MQRQMLAHIYDIGCCDQPSKLECPVWQIMTDSPVDGAAVYERWICPQAGTERVPDWTHAEHSVHVCPACSNKEAPQLQGRLETLFGCSIAHHLKNLCRKRSGMIQGQAPRTRRYTFGSNNSSNDTSPSCHTFGDSNNQTPQSVQHAGNTSQPVGFRTLVRVLKHVNQNPNPPRPSCCWRTCLALVLHAKYVWLTLPSPPLWENTDFLGNMFLNPKP